MQTQYQATAHSLYVLYQALPEESKQFFLQELLGNQAELKNHFADICGILTATRSVSLEEMEEVISQQGKDSFDDSY